MLPLVVLPLVVLPLVVLTLDALELPLVVLVAATVEDAAGVEGVPEAEEAPLVEATVLELSSTK